MTSASTPAISVLMTAYNREDFIGDAIASVLASDFKDFELIVVDDGSTDGTVKIARRFEAIDHRVRVIVNEHNLGDYPNRNKAASHARGTYLKYVDSDDMVYPWGLGIMFRCMQGFPDAGFGLSARAEFDRPHPVLMSPLESYREEFFGRELFGRAPGSAIIRRSAFESLGGFSGMRQLGDFEFWLKIGALSPLVTLPPALSWDRVHSGQELAVNTDIEKTAMRVSVVFAALAAPSCPFDQAARTSARLAYRNKLRRGFWHLVKRLNFGEAIEYAQTVIRPAKQLCREG